MTNISRTLHCSIEEHYDRKGCIGFAPNELLDWYNKHPESPKNVIPAALCPKNEPSSHRLMLPIHFDILVFLLVLLWHIYRMRWYWAHHGARKCQFTWHRR
jgi:hypothetical protein